MNRTTSMPKFILRKFCWIRVSTLNWNSCVTQSCSQIRRPGDGKELKVFFNVGSHLFWSLSMICISFLNISYNNLVLNVFPFTQDVPDIFLGSWCWIFESHVVLFLVHIFSPDCLIHLGVLMIFDFVSFRAAVRDLFSAPSLTNRYMLIWWVGGQS